MGIFLFWLLYTICAVLMWMILFKQYDLKTGERIKHPLWMYIIAFILFLIPVLNFAVCIVYFIYNDVENGRKICYKSFLNKKY